MIFKEKYLEIKQINGVYHVTPHSGWSIVIKSCFTRARTIWGLNRCINYWKKQGYGVKNG
jgi:hypothetical protein